MKFLLLLLLPCICHSQTCVVPVITSEGVTIGVDTRAVFMGQKYQMHKILPVGKYFVAMSGTFEEQLDEIIKGIAVKENLKATVSHFVAERKEHLEHIIPLKKAQFPEFYKGEDVLNGMLFFGFDNDSLKVFYVTFVEVHNMFTFIVRVL